MHFFLHRLFILRYSALPSPPPLPSSPSPPLCCSLYCNEADNSQRRATQTALYLVLVHFLAALAPILPHLTEEAALSLPLPEGQSGQPLMIHAHKHTHAHMHAHTTHIHIHTRTHTHTHTYTCTCTHATCAHTHIAHTHTHTHARVSLWSEWWPYQMWSVHICSSDSRQCLH